MEKSEKGEKSEDMEKSEKKARGKGITFLQVISLILIIVLIAIVLIVVQVPYITNNVINETVPVEKCTQTDIPFVSNFRTGLNYDTAPKIYSLDGMALHRYSELKSFLFVTIRNAGEEKGVYCINAQAYLIENFTNGEESLDLFQNLLSQDSPTIQKIDNWNSNRYVYPVCTENPILPIYTDKISLMTSSLLSTEVQEEYNLDNVYILFTVVPPTSKQCSVEDETKTTEQEVTKYCNAWKHLVGRC